MNLLDWYWLKKLNRFQVYYSILYHLYTCVYHQVKSPSITIYPPFAFFYLLPTPIFPLIITVLLSVSMSFCFVFSFALYIFHPAQQPLTLLTTVNLSSIYESVYLSFSDWLISLSIMISRFKNAVAKGKICFFFYSWVDNFDTLLMFLLPIKTVFKHQI